MTPEALAAIKARCDAATEGPWTHFADLDEVEVSSDGTGIFGPQYPGSTIDTVGVVETTVADLKFIAHARQDVPALLAEVERLRTRLEAVLPYGD